MQALNQVGESNKIILVWIPAYQCLHGNKVADSLKRLGTLEGSTSQAVGVPIALGKASSGAT